MTLSILSFIWLLLFVFVSLVKATPRDGCMDESKLGVTELMLCQHEATDCALVPIEFTARELEQIAIYADAPVRQPTGAVKKYVCQAD